MSDWIEWTGGEMPVLKGTLIDIRHRDGDEYLARPAGDGYSLFWNDSGGKGDIVAYRLSRDPQSLPADNVSHPAHYTAHPSGVECITVTEHMGFNLGNAVKYIWRADLKNDAIEDLRKARWYISREIAKREQGISADLKDRLFRGGPLPSVVRSDP